MQLLAMRMHSESELRNKLKVRGAGVEDTDKVIDFLKECGFIDDRNFAQLYAEELRANKKYGTARIKSELYKKGITPDIISEILEDMEFDRDELYSLIENKLNGDFSKKSADRAIRYFTYRGYSLSDIFSCINEIRGCYDEEDYY